MIEDEVQEILKKISKFKHLRSGFVPKITDKKVIEKLARKGYQVKECSLPNFSKLEW